MTLPFGSGTNQAISAQRCRVEALTVQRLVVPEAAIEREFAERRTDAAVDVDLGGGAVGEVDALAGNSGIGLQVGVDVVARLEAGCGRRPVVRLRDAAEIVDVRHQCADYGDVPYRRRRCRRRDGGLDRHVGGQGDSGSQARHCKR